MFRKILVGSLIFIVLGSLYIGYTYIKKQQLPEFDTFKAIPVDASIIIECHDFIDKINQVRFNNKIWQELTLMPSMALLDSELEHIVKLYTENQIFREILGNSSLVISMHKMGKQDVGFLFLLRLHNFRTKKYILETITNLIGAENDISVRDYNNAKIYKLVTNSKEVHFSFYKGIFIYSPSALLIENSIRQSDIKNSLLNDQGFVNVNKTAGKNVDANIYINLVNFNELISFALDNRYKNLISRFSALGNWAELDINLKESAVLLNGFTFSKDSLNNYLNIFLAQQPVDHKINSILPSNTSIFITLGISDIKEYLKNYRAYLKKEGKINKYQLQLDQYKNRYNIDLEDFFEEYLDQEIGVVVTDDPANSIDENTYIVMRTKSKSITQNKLDQFITKIIELEDKDRTSLINDLKIDKETTYKVYSLPLSNMFSTFFGSVFPNFNNQYVIFIDNFLVIGNSKRSVSKFIHSNILHKTLDNDLRFEQFSDYLSTRSNFYFYTNMFRSPNYISDLLNPSLKKGLNENIESFKKFQAFAVQFQHNNDMIYNNLYLQYVPEVKKEAVTVWESHLDTSLNFKPVLVINHYTKENEIFVQDLNNKIYLINKVGRILWKLQLNEKINSDIYQVDFYKNGKLQLLFSTENRIHLIDRNGNYVERYPFMLRSPSTAGLAMFDYDNTLDYRIIIPCRNKNVYLYNIEGNLVNGWNFGQTDTYVTMPVQHFRAGDNDYIVFADKFRVYILNRRGEERIRVKTQFSKSIKNNFILESGNPNANPRFVTTDTSSLVKMIYFDGTVESKQIGKYSVNHYFDYQDMDADGLKDYIFLDKNKLEVLTQDENELFDHKFDENIDLSPIYYYFSYEDRKLGIISRKTNELFLFNSDGNLYEGFPLKGNTQFTIGYLGNSNNQFNLLVGNQYNFLYNYSVN